jgi:hypothetical protein
MKIKSFFQKLFGANPEPKRVDLEIKVEGADHFNKFFKDMQKKFEELEQKRKEEAAKRKYPAGTEVYFIVPWAYSPLRGIISESSNDMGDMYRIYSPDNENTPSVNIHVTNIFPDLISACNEFIRRNKVDKIIIEANIEAVSKILDEQP